jgi:maleate cis-trans isomerase
VKKFGCICPSVINLPWDLSDAIGADLAVAVVTLNVRNGLPGEQERAVSIMRGATDVLIDEGCEAIVVMGVPVSARRGFAAERAALNALTVDRGAVPIASALAASAAALRGRGVTRPLLVTQYAPDVNAQLIDFYRDAGIEAAGATGLNARNAAEVNALSTDDFYALAKRAFRESEFADGIFLSARGNMCENASKLERELGVPVLDQIQAGVWWARSELNASLTLER